jgi:hypothetical protein
MLMNVFMVNVDEKARFASAAYIHASEVAYSSIRVDDMPAMYPQLASCALFGPVMSKRRGGAYRVTWVA